MPYYLGARANQGLWVDVYAPPDTKPGVYTGSVLVTSGRTRIAELPVKLTVWEFALPDTFAMRSNFGGLGGRLAQNLGMDAGTEEFRRVEDLTIDALLAHRCQPSGLGNIWPARTDDGGRLWVNGRLLAQKWMNQAPTDAVGSIELTAGVPVPIRMEYYENGGGAMATLRWSSPSVPEQVVPTANLFSAQ